MKTIYQTNFDLLFNRINKIIGFTISNKETCTEILNKYSDSKKNKIKSIDFDKNNGVCGIVLKF